MDTVKMKIFVIAATIIVSVSSQFSPQSKTTSHFINCSQKNTCNECIQIFGCVWCSDPKINAGKCQNEKEVQCNKDFVINHEIKIVQTVNISSTMEKDTKRSNKKVQNTSNKNTIVQVTPQFIAIKIRPIKCYKKRTSNNGTRKRNESVALDDTDDFENDFTFTTITNLNKNNEGHPIRIKLHYHQAANYPLDIYYLMDSSNSQLLEKYSLAMPALGRKLAETISKVTSDLQLGFGSFVDKPVSPFISIVPKEIINPCDICIPSYGFRNYMPLSSNLNSFTKIVSSLNMSSNLDTPEGGFDGIMQAIVCRKEIGWRNKSRKLLVYSTDAPFHIAGDGKIGGIVKPNDGCCHLDKKGFYNYSMIQDYPSISQINQKVRENSVNIIFSVPKEQSELYKTLTTFIDGSFLGIKKDMTNYSDVIRIITEQYNEITSSVELYHSHLGEHLKLKYYSKCLNSIESPLTETNKCNGLKINNTLEFEIDIEQISCPTKKADMNHQFFIWPVGVDERVTVNVSMQCDCECEKQEHRLYEKNSTTCSNHGTLKCGVCECDSGYSGNNCSCPYNENEMKTDNCRPHDEASILCSNRGACICNKCYCNSNSATEVFWGEYCQCNNLSCPYHNGKLCSAHGQCVCNKCICDKGWSGNDCSCENSLENCFNEENTGICSENGDCVCNKCVCRGNGQYSGKYCEECKNCNTKCEELKECVLCILENSHLPQDCCSNYSVQMTLENFENLIATENYIRCWHANHQNCKYMYAYKIRKKITDIVIQSSEICQLLQSPLKIVFSIVSGIIAVGFICLIIWKIFAVIQDRKEVLKFEEERSKSMWENVQNPLYKAPFTKYENPLFEGNCSSKRSD
ncbi:hypothetical protein PGB90_009612 [Kerria lacca]